MTRSSANTIINYKLVGNKMIKRTSKRKRSENNPEKKLKTYGKLKFNSKAILKWCKLLEQRANQEFRNQFEDVMDRIDDDILSEFYFSFLKTTGGAMLGDVRVLNHNISSYPEIRKMALNMKRGDKKVDINVTIDFLKYLLFVWGTELNTRDIEEKKSIKGIKLTMTYLQTKKYIKQLIMELENKILAEDVENMLSAIVENLLRGNYNLVNDYWFELTNGYLPCPIEVVIMDIDEKVENIPGNIDESVIRRTSNKPMRALKRLMVKCQEYYPTVPRFALSEAECKTLKEKKLQVRMISKRIV